MWFNRWENIMLLQNIQIQFLEHTLSGLTTTISPASGDPFNTSDLHTHLHSTCEYLHTGIYTWT